jgi:hypothetical protein
MLCLHGAIIENETGLKGLQFLGSGPDLSEIVIRELDKCVI